jgi:hypothetical protein
MKIIIALIGLFLATELNGQNVEFTYDNAGNRITRIIVYLPTPQFQDENKNDNEDIIPDTLVAVESNCIIDSSTGAWIKIYPNPVMSSLNIDLGSIYSNKKRMTIHILDIQGKSINVQDVSTQIVNVDFSNVSIGTYLITLKENGALIRNWKIIKQ